jgi:ABC-2 type transport system permease protein
LWIRFAKQEQVHLAASAIAPFLSIRTVSMAFAGTDFAHHAHFAAAAEDYRRLIQRTINTDITYNAGNAKGTYERGAELWNKIPEFDYETPGLSWVLARQWPALSMLFFWTLAAVILAWWSTQRIVAD